MRIGLMVPELNLPDDAVGNDVLGMYNTIVHLGFACRVFTAIPHTHLNINSGTYLDAAVWLRKGDLLIYQYASGGVEALKLVRDLPCKTSIRYHNVTPSHFFQGISVEYQKTANEGRDLLKKFLSLPNCYAISASAYSSSELVAAGLPSWRSEVVAPFHVIDNLVAATGDVPDKGTSDGFELLTVSRMSPNKKIELLLECYADVVAKIDIPVTLTVVGGGDPRLQLYKNKIDEVLYRRGINNAVQFAEKLSIAELANCYRRADIFVTCSAHEGFCMPAIEAMAFGVPVVAAKEGALPETCGGAAIICSDRTDFVDAILRLISDENLRADFGKRGRQHYSKQFSSKIIEAKFSRAIDNMRHPTLSRLRFLQKWIRSLI
jgi:glycosyltransferase involved in cell wall biosynthesis